MDRPPFSGTHAIHAAPADTRAIAWQAADAEVRAVQLGTANDWPDDGSTDPQVCINHNPRTLIYPGAAFGLSTPVASARLKRLRRGVLDAAYLALLRSRGDRATVERMTSTLIRHYGADAYGVHLADGRIDPWVDDERYWSLARRIMGRAIAQSMDAAASMTDAIDPIRFQDDLRRIRVAVRGMRLLPGTEGIEQPSRVRCVLEIENRTDSIVDGTVQVADVPMNWQVAQQSPSIGPLPPGQRRIVTIEAAAASIGWNEHGVLDLPVELHTSDDQVTRVTARLCHVTPQRLERPIRIDGDVDDWPIGVGNYASDFLPISGRPESTAPSSAPAVKHATVCSVAYDQSHLYFGFKCATESGAKAKDPVLPTGSLDDLVPVGTDLVEVLIDPLSTPARLPCRMIRIAVSQRSVQAEIGIETDPPICAVRTWPAVVKHAIEVYTDYWTAELAIPISALGDSWRPGRAIGLNFARFDAASQEYSNWSGAVGNTYDPLSFGNMTIP